MKCYSCKNVDICKHTERWFQALETLKIFEFLSQENGSRAIMTLQAIYDDCKFYEEVNNNEK